MPTRSATIAPKYTAAAGRRAAMMPGVDSERLRPFLLVDIDGVLSVYDVQACPEGYEELQLFADDPEPSLLCRAHAQWLAELARAFDLVWASAWGFQANERLCPVLGLDPLPFVPMPPIPLIRRRRSRLSRHTVGDRPAAWLDDLIGDEARQWAEQRHEELSRPVDRHVMRLEIRRLIRVVR
jgi:hypothetical protein